MSFYKEYRLQFDGDDGTNVILEQTVNRLGLMVDFNIKKTTTSTSNSASISITNPSFALVSALQKKGSVAFSAGYANDVARILYGKKEEARYSESDGATRIDLSILEGVGSSDSLIFSKVYGAGTAQRIIIDDLVNYLISNVPTVIAANAYQIASFNTYATTQVIFGNAFEILRDILTSIGYQYFISNGVITIIATNGYILDLEVLVSPSSGLIGSPSPIAESEGESSPKKGVQFRSLLNYNFDVGRRIRLISRNFDNAVFKIEEVSFIGNSFDGDWVCDVRAFEL